jgi:hypothetical protein
MRKTEKTALSGEDPLRGFATTRPHGGAMHVLSKPTGKGVGSIFYGGVGPNTARRPYAFFDKIPNSSWFDVFVNSCRSNELRQKNAARVGNVETL